MPSRRESVVPRSISTADQSMLARFVKLSAQFDF